MEETTNLLDKTAAELTVRDQLVLSIAVPVVMIGTVVAAGYVANGVSRVASKIRNRKSTTNVETSN